MTIENAGPEEFLEFFYRCEPEVLYDTGDFSIVWKPHDMPCAPLKENEEGTLLYWYLHQSCCRGEAGLVAGRKAVECGLLHRLDTATAGLVLIAKKQEAFDFLNAAQKSGLFQKTYKAFCSDITESSVIPVERKISPDAGSYHISVESRFRGFGPKGREVRPVFFSSRMWNKCGSRGYCTEIQRVEKTLSGDCVCVLCSLENGFRHQVRIHLASCGLPICGDKLYNPLCRSCRTDGCYLQLFAVALSFPDPHGSGTIFFSLPQADKKSL